MVLQSPSTTGRLVQIQENPLVKEPLEIRINNLELGQIENNEYRSDPNDTYRHTYSLASPNLQVPSVSSSETRRRLSSRRGSGRMSSHNSIMAEAEHSVVQIWDRFTRKGKKNIGVVESLRAIAFSSWINIFFVLVPIAWVSHFLHWPLRITFALSFLAIIPLGKLAEWGGEEMTFYLGKDLGDLLIVTLNNAVEATLAIILLTRCEISLLKSTIVGVVILHLLLIPGIAFISGGARILHQDLHPHLTELNHSLLALGVLSLMLPAAFFAALNNNFDPKGTAADNGVIINDVLRGDILKMSRGIACCLLLIYVCSRIYLHYPPGEKQPLSLHLLPAAPEGLKEHELHLQETDPCVNQYVCVVMLAICISLMAATAEWLVRALEFARSDSGLRIEFFGLILLPLVSYAGDGSIAIAYHIRHLLRYFFLEPHPPTTLAKGRAIDLSIQFTLFWMPFFVLLGWWTGRPMTLLFDFFEVAVLIGACFIVNYVTADSKTNWAEGATMVSFYIMIALCAWFYPGQVEAWVMSECASVADSLAELANGQGLAAEIHR